MKRWLSRSLWLAAWSFWLWLGFGLYRELPRDLGPVACILQFEPTEVLIGFLDDQHEVVARPRVGGNLKEVYSIYDATTGLRIRRTTIDRLSDNQTEFSVSSHRSHSHRARGERAFADQWYYSGWRVPERLRTVAIKDDETRRLIVREWDRGKLQTEIESPDRTLLVLPDGTVHRLPRLVNYPLLVPSGHRLGCTISQIFDSHGNLRSAGVLPSWGREVRPGGK